MNVRRIGWIAGLAAAAAAAGTALVAQQYGYTDTPLLPDSKWLVHDAARPLPRVVDPGTGVPAAQPGKAPSDAVVLFDGTNLDRWHNGSGQAGGWKIEDGAMRIPTGAETGKGSLVSRDEFGDCQIHVEYAAPSPARDKDQGRGNSGVIIMGRYEIQVLDNYQNPTYADGHAASVYGQYPPLVNANRPPGEWQALDILFTAPRFNGNELESPGYVTVLHNGVAVHHHARIIGAVAHRAVGKYSPHGPKGPIVLQDHGSPVRFRNIWVRELKPYDEP